MLPPPTPAPASLVQHALIVTHASKLYDCGAAAKPGIDSLIADFRRQGLPVVFLVSTGDVQPADLGQWYTADRSPTHLLISGGDFDFAVESNEVTLAGGFFGACQLATVAAVINNHTKADELVIHFPMRATYVPSDPARHPGDEPLTLEAVWSEEKDVRTFAKTAWKYLAPLTDRCKHCFGLDKNRYRFSVVVRGKLVRQIGRGSKRVTIAFE